MKKKKKKIISIQYLFMNINVRLKWFLTCDEWNFTAPLLLLINRRFVQPGIHFDTILLIPPCHPWVHQSSQLRRCIAPSTFLSTSPKSQSRQKEGLAPSYLSLLFVPRGRRLQGRAPLTVSSLRILPKGDRWTRRCDGRGKKRPFRQKVTCFALLQASRSKNTHAVLFN